jgi:hypothetical protein
MEQPLSELQTSVGVEKIDLLLWRELMLEVSAGQQMETRAARAGIAAASMALYLSKVVNVTEQDIP